MMVQAAVLAHVLNGDSVYRTYSTIWWRHSAYFIPLCMHSSRLKSCMLIDRHMHTYTHIYTHRHMYCTHTYTQTQTHLVSLTHRLTKYFSSQWSGLVDNIH